MRIYLLGIVLVGLLSSGCSSDWDPARTADTVGGKEEGPAGQNFPSTAMKSRSATSFASLPDRGELLRYSADRKVRRSGAYTLHPVELSEAHALNAIASGELKLRTPDGKDVGIKYDRIEEDPNGNWSWVGKNDSGEHAVLTFGERAAFGQVFADGQTLNIVVRDGAAWLMETDRTALAGRGPQTDSVDYLIPPESLPVVGMAGAKATMSSSASIPTKSVSVVDLAVGYTNGFLTAQQSQAAAVTRITYLVALTNAAYQRSGVNMRIRLVNATQVTFPDNTDNTDALQKLTGYNQSSQQFVAADPAFSALRAARDEFGADLVALVRPHRAPEQKGCGIAWLIGANGANIVPATHERFGYAVVADGADEDESDGNNYFCSEYSLAHELGHNMGQVHNQADAPVAGRHPYSYGFRETSTTGFHTVMAYPLSNSSQVEVGYFATPLINYAAGRPLGNAANADNVRSLNETMPLIASFRSTVVPLQGVVRNDVNGDGKGDILWRNTALQQFSHWVMDGTSIVSSAARTMISSYHIAGTGDFNGDGLADVLWKNDAARYLIIWQSSGTGEYTQLEIGGFSPGMTFAGIGDFDANGRSDILWHERETNQLFYWSMTGRTPVQSAKHPMPSWFQIIGVGDFNGDGAADIAYTNAVDVNLYLNNGNGSLFRGQRLAYNPTGWTLLGIADSNGDRVSDFFWQNSVSGVVALWNLSAAEVVSTPSYAPHPVLSFAALGDFNGDGRADVLWNRSEWRQLSMWLSQPAGGYSAAVVGYFPAGWEVDKN